MAMFATILKRDRIRNGMTQAQVARRLGISLATYRAVEAEDEPATADFYARTVKPVLLARGVCRAGRRNRVQVASPPSGVAVSCWLLHRREATRMLRLGIARRSPGSGDRLPFESASRRATRTRSAPLN
jgi:DNA-binding XRE family transcriptional regulator